MLSIEQLHPNDLEICISKAGLNRTFIVIISARHLHHISQPSGFKSPVPTGSPNTSQNFLPVMRRSKPQNLRSSRLKQLPSGVILGLLKTYRYSIHRTTAYSEYQILLQIHASSSAYQVLWSRRRVYGSLYQYRFNNYRPI